jgi:hypothetical protein
VTPLYVVAPAGGLTASAQADWAGRDGGGQGNRGFSSPLGRRRGLAAAPCLAAQGVLVKIACFVTRRQLAVGAGVDVDSLEFPDLVLSGSVTT